MFFLPGYVLTDPAIPDEGFDSSACPRTLVCSSAAISNSRAGYFCSAIILPKLGLDAKGKGS
jgi:hypothetical protein